MSDPQIDDIRARLEAATPGPWMVDPDDAAVVMRPDERHPNGWDGVMIAVAKGGEMEATFIADLIAHAPTDLAFLLSRLESAEARIAKARAVWVGPDSLPAHSAGSAMFAALTEGTDHE